LDPQFPILKNAYVYVRRLADFNRISTQETLVQLRTLSRETEAPELHSFDFDRLYTGIPLDDLIEKFSELLDDLWAYQATKQQVPTSNSLILQLTNGKATWVHTNRVAMHMTQPQPGMGFMGVLREDAITTLLFDSLCIKTMFAFSVQNTFLFFAGQIFKQVVGIPMGANHCVYVANFYLLQYERLFFQNILEAVQDPEPVRSTLAKTLLATFRYMGRFIDDELCLTHNPSLFLRFLPQQHEEHGIHGIYPPHLGFKVTSCEPKTMCNFLNLRISITPHALGHKAITGIFRKDKIFFKGKVSLIRMPFFHSIIPDRYKFNVLHSQVVEYTRHCNTPRTAAKAIAELMHYFAGHGYHMRPMWGRLSRSLRRLPVLYGTTPRALLTLTGKYFAQCPGYARR
jgi:hypothetical protein